jgi:hypothetical protein
LKHLVLFLVLALGGYFAWRYSPVSIRNQVRLLLATHFIVVVGIILIALGGLIAQFFFSSTQIL